MYQSFLKLCFFVVFVYGTGAYATDDDGTYCDGTGWIAFRDEKCYKLIKKWATQNDSKQMCAEEFHKLDSSNPQLVSIKSADEQNFLTDYIFEESGVEINVWTGAKRVPNSNQFVWDDGSSMEYTNWAEGSPTEESISSCVVMQSRAMKNEIRRINGKWRDVSCGSPNYVVCEKLPRWSNVKLQKTILEQRKQQLVTENELTATKTELSQTKNRLSNVENNPVPIGFIYVQLSSQPEPQTLWPTVQWKDVTSDYAGLFFRAEGGGSAQFGTLQDENAPRLTQVRLNPAHQMPEQHDGWWTTNLNVGGWNTGVGVFSGSWNGQLGYAHQFLYSGGEIRPSNMAMRVWKRT